LILKVGNVRVEVALDSLTTVSLKNQTLIY
jgi:hypothetical protein